MHSLRTLKPKKPVAFSRAIRVMSLIIFSTAISGSAFPSQAQPQQIVAIVSRDLQPYRQALAGFKDVLAQFEAQASVRVYYMNGAPEPRLREEISSHTSDLILCVGSEATRFVQELETKSPMVFCVVSGLEDQEAVEIEGAAARIAGVTTDIPLAAQFDTLRNALPNVKKIGVVYDRRTSAALIEKAAHEAQARGLELLAVPVSGQKEVPAAFDQLENDIDALWSILDRTVYSSESARFILTFALRTKTPFMAYSPQYVKAGALFALSCDYSDLGRQAGEIAVEALQSGRMPSPRILRPRKYLLSVNLRVMRAIGCQLPHYLLRGADMVFE